MYKDFFRANSQTQAVYRCPLAFAPVGVIWACVMLLCLLYPLLPCAEEPEQPEQDYWLLVLDSVGGVQGACIGEGTISCPIRLPDTVAPSAERILPIGDDGYLLLEGGRLLALDHAPMPSSVVWDAHETITDARYDSYSEATWLLTRTGKIYIQVGLEREPIELALPEEHEWQRLDVDASTNRLLVLDTQGRLYIYQDQQQVYEAELPGAVAASLVPGATGVAALDRSGRLFYGDPVQVQLAEVSQVSVTSAIDLEILPDHRAFILDSYGQVRDAEDKPIVQFEAMEFPFARDLAYTRFDDPRLEPAHLERNPLWLPPAAKTRVYLYPDTVIVGPPGGSRSQETPLESSRNTPGGSIELRISGAKEVPSWEAEIHFDPDTLIVLKDDVEAGSWWLESAAGADSQASVNMEQGILKIQGISAAQEGGGANGDGTLARIGLRSKNDRAETGAFELVRASVSHTALPFVDWPAGEPQAVTVMVQAPPRNLELIWTDPSNVDSADSRVVDLKPGGTVKTSLQLEAGAIINGLSASFEYDPETIRPVAAYPGELWRGRGKIEFRERELPGGQLRCLLRVLEEVENAEFQNAEGGEVLSIIWRVHPLPKANPGSECDIRLLKANVYSKGNLYATRVRLGVEPLQIRVR